MKRGELTIIIYNNQNNQSFFITRQLNPLRITYLPKTQVFQLAKHSAISDWLWPMATLREWPKADG
ncbi:MAG: hypothetical protein F6K56_12825 [Moorea sp. SIO3G5]|nr:hypothetical protein [Moorena sp. SIO3G5]